MSKLDEKYVLEALKRGIEKEKLEEKVLASFGQQSNPIYSSSDLQKDDSMKKSRKYFDDSRLFKKIGTSEKKQNDWITKAFAVSQFADNPNQLDIKDLLKPFVTGDTT